MKGLFIKDLSLVTAKKSTYILYFIIIAVLSISGDSFFSLAYGMFLFGMVAISTTAYDEMGGGMAYLMTLPVTARDYVAEKHLFCFLSSLLGFAASALFTIIASLTKGGADQIFGSIADAVPMLFIYFGISSVMIFVDIKAGIRKSRTVMIVIYAVIFSVVFALKNILGGREEGIELGSELSPLLLILIFAAAGGILFAVFYSLSLKAMKNKEY